MLGILSYTKRGCEDRNYWSHYAGNRGDDQSKNVYGLKFLDDKATIAVTQNLVKKLKEEDKCDLIVAVGHLGSEDANRGHRSDDILINVNGIDILSTDMIIRQRINISMGRCLQRQDTIRKYRRHYPHG